MGSLDERNRSYVMGYALSAGGKEIEHIRAADAETLRGKPHARRFNGRLYASFAAVYAGKRVGTMKYPAASKEGLQTALLSVQNVSKMSRDHDCRVHAVRDASPEVRQGEIVAVAAPLGKREPTPEPDGDSRYTRFRRDLCGQTKDSEPHDAVRCRVRNQCFGRVVQDFALIEEDASLQSAPVPTLCGRHKGAPGNIERSPTNGRAPQSCKMRLPPSMTAISSRVINSFPDF